MSLIIYILIFFAILAGAVFFVIKKAIEKRATEKRRKWAVPLAQLDLILPEVELNMIDAGFGKSDYVTPGHDCSEYAREWMRRIKAFLKPHRPKGETEWIKQYSFQRDKRADGTDPGRHRVVAIKTDAGMKCIDTYRINGSLYRTLSETEKQAGYYL